jgi:hypothetical protein
MPAPASSPLPTPWRSDDPGAAAPWPDARSSLRFELLPNVPPRPNQGAFVTLSKDGAHSQVLLARVSAGPTVLAEVAFVVQKDRYGSDEGVNPRIEAKLARKREALRKLGAETDAAPRLLDVFAPDAELGRAAPSPPLLYCMKKTAFFHPRCGSCGGVLRDCREDGLLLSVNAKIASEGKPGRVGTYTDSTERYLHCAECTKKNGGVPPTLYVRAFAGDHRSSDAYAGRVKNQLGLFRDMGAAMHERRLDASHLPCATCEHRDLCYPATQLDSNAPGKQYVLEVVRPLSFHDFTGYVAERLDLRYDHAVQLMGGRALEEIEAALPYRDQPAALEIFSRRVKSALGGGRGLLYGDDTGLRGLEVLRAKLALFTDLCRAVRETHRVVGPHLDLRPENVMTMVADHAPGVPTLWNLRAKVLGAGSAAPSFEGRPGFPADFFDAPDDVDPVYSPPVLREYRESTKPIRVRALTVTGVERTPEGAVVRVELAGAGTPLDLGEKDRVVATLETDDQALVDLALCLRPEGRSETTRGQGKLTMVGDPLPLVDWQLNSLKELVGIPFHNVKCRVHRRLHVPCDLFALGTMLLQTLLETIPEAEVGEGQGPAALREAALALVDRAVETARSDSPSGRPADHDTARVVLEILADEDDSWRAMPPEARAGRKPPWFARENVFYDRRTRDDSAAETIPRDLFHDAVLIALKLVSRVRGFSYAADESDYDPAAPYAKLDAVLRDLDRLNEKVRSQMFGAARLNRDVNRAIQEIRSSSGTTLFGGGTILISNAEEEAQDRADALSTDIDRMAAESFGAPEALFARVRDRIKSEIEQSQGVFDPTLLCEELQRRYPYVDERSRRDGARVAELLAACTEIVSKSRDVAFGAEGPGSTQFVVGAADPASELKRALRIVELFGHFVDAADAAPDTFAEIEQLKAARDRRFGRVRSALQTWFSTSNLGDARDHAKLTDAVRRTVTLLRDVPLRLSEAYSFSIRRGLRDVLGRFKPADEQGFFGRKEELERLQEAFAQLSAQLENEPLTLLRRYFDPHFRQKFDELAASRRRDDDGVAPTRLANETEAAEAAGGAQAPKKKKR